MVGKADHNTVFAYALSVGSIVKKNGIRVVHMAAIRANIQTRVRHRMIIMTIVVMFLDIMKYHFH